MVLVSLLRGGMLYFAEATGSWGWCSCGFLLKVGLWTTKGLVCFFMSTLGVRLEMLFTVMRLLFCTPRELYVFRVSVFRVVSEGESISPLEDVRDCSSLI